MSGRGKKRDDVKDKRVVNSNRSHKHAHSSGTDSVNSTIGRGLKRGRNNQKEAQNRPSKKMSKSLKGAYLDDDFISSDKINNFSIDDLYFDSHMEDPEVVARAFKQSLSYEKNQNYYESKINNYANTITDSRLFKGMSKDYIPSLHEDSTTVSLVGQNAIVESTDSSTAVYILTEEDISSIYNEKKIYFNHTNDRRHYEKMKETSVYNNIEYKKSDIIGQSRKGSNALNHLFLLGWDTLKKSSNGGNEDFFVRFVEMETAVATNEFMLSCYHFTYYGPIMAKTRALEIPDNVDYGRALVLTQPGIPNKDDINTSSPFDILVFIKDDIIYHLCYIPNCIFLT